MYLLREIHLLETLNPGKSVKQWRNQSVPGPFRDWITCLKRTYLSFIVDSDVTEDDIEIIINYPGLISEK